MADEKRRSVNVDHQPNVGDVAAVRAGLMAFNERCVGAAGLAHLAVYVRADDGTICGGLVGYTAWQWLSVDLLWVDERLRGQGYGSELMAAAEAAARDRGCLMSRLDTYECQARPFYERLGYTVYGICEGYPAGTRQFFMRKTL